MKEAALPLYGERPDLQAALHADRTGARKTGWKKFAEERNRPAEARRRRRAAGRSFRAFSAKKTLRTGSETASAARRRRSFWKSSLHSRHCGCIITVVSATGIHAFVPEREGRPARIVMHPHVRGGAADTEERESSPWPETPEKGRTACSLSYHDSNREVEI